MITQILVRAFFCAILSLAFVPSTAVSQRLPNGDGEKVVWQHLTNELQRGREEKDYWLRHWRTPMPESIEGITLGKPYPRYRLADNDVRLFVDSGDLLKSANLLMFSYPVMDRGKLIGTVQIQERSGAWAWYSTHHPAGSADSLAISFQDKASSVTLVGADHLGAFLIYTPSNGAETRVYPLQSDVRSYLGNKLDPNGTLSYSAAMQALLPVAIERVERQKRPESQDE